MSVDEGVMQFDGSSDASSKQAKKWKYHPYSTSSSENEEELDLVGPLVEPDATFIGGLSNEGTLKIRAVSRNGGNLDDFLSVMEASPRSIRRKNSTDFNSPTKKPLLSSSYRS